MNNPCADPSYATITSTSGAVLQAQTYIVSQGDKPIAQPTDIVINDPFKTVCGNLVFTGYYGPEDPMPVIDDEGSPLAYNDPDYNINTIDPLLIGLTEPYKLIVSFEDYPNASKYESQSTITYFSPCPLVDEELEFVEFTPQLAALTSDLYSDTPINGDVTALFTVRPSFCIETMTFACIGVTGPDINGDEVVYEGTDYPATLCTLSEENVLTVRAGLDNYSTLDNPTINMPVG